MNTFGKFITFFLLVAVVLGQSEPEPEPAPEAEAEAEPEPEPEPEGPNPFMDIEFSDLIRGLRLTYFAMALQKAGITGTDIGSSDEPMTIFAPTNRAFRGMPMMIKKHLKENPEKLKMLLMMHMIPGMVTTRDMKKMMKDMMKDRMDKDVKKMMMMMRGPDMIVNGARIVAPNIMGKNVVIHLVDRLMMPMNKNGPRMRPGMDMMGWGPDMKGMPYPEPEPESGESGEEPEPGMAPMPEMEPEP